MSLIQRPMAIFKSALNVRRIPVKTHKFISLLTGERNIIKKYSYEYDIKAKNYSEGEYAAQFKGKKNTVRVETTEHGT